MLFAVPEKYVDGKLTMVSYLFLFMCESYQNLSKKLSKSIGSRESCKQDQIVDLSNSLAVKTYNMNILRLAIVMN
jgi:hypothetical protein